MTSMTDTDARAEYIAGLRAIADALDHDTTLGIPFHGHASAAMIFPRTREELIAWTRLLTERNTPVIREYEPYGFKLDGQICGFTVSIHAPLDIAGEPNGTRTVTTYELAPELAAGVELFPAATR